MMHALLLSLSLAAIGPEVELRTLDGQNVVGQLVELSAEQVTVKTGEGPQTVAADKLLGLSPRTKSSPPAEKPSAWIDLVDGSVIPAKSYAVSAGKAALVLLDGSSLEIQTRDIAAVRLQASTEAIDKEWDRIREGQHAADVLVIRKEATIDYHRGVLHDVNESTVTFELDGEKIPVKRTKAFGLLYYHKDRELPGAICTIAAGDGSHWAVRTLAYDGALRWTTPSGVAVTRPLEALANLDFSGGKIVYLSDLKPDSVQWTPYFGTAQQLPAVAEFYAPRMDQSLSAKPLQLSGETYAKGLAIHSRTEIVYRLPGRFSRFRALAGIDDDVAPNGHVQLVIRGDDKVLLDTTVAGGEKPKPIDLDLSGVRRLVIFVDFGEKLDVADHLDLAMARISK